MLDEPVPAREIQLTVLPLAGRGVGLSEIQAFSSVVVNDWPDREVDLGGGAVWAPEDGDVAPRTPSASAWRPTPPTPAPSSPTICRAPPGGHRLIHVRGLVLPDLVHRLRPAGAHRAYWDGRDEAGRSSASGVYLVVAEWQGTRSVGRITLVR